ncbi:hypothetical protein H9657_18250 [Cellulomonas sp. Sa3CUA2]|uniref:Transposase TnpC homeodomain domain-containing protein n=1 Tax=Cellulomonas avistercoris TaxID=2762242 RepID=A0ABR8QIF6_9CELL|nr:hypothetical protein [Cellulomonas avistercoris]MBD7920218.1 hypothetical protein [Cellulomonas avistercoris]
MSMPEAQDVGDIVELPSLEQALREREVAQARMVDLRSRLTQSRVENAALRARVAELEGLLGLSGGPVGDDPADGGSHGDPVAAPDRTGATRSRRRLFGTRHR